MAKAQSGKDKKSKEQVLLEAVDDLNIISGIDKVRYYRKGTS